MAATLLIHIEIFFSLYVKTTHLYCSFAFINKDSNMKVMHYRILAIRYTVCKRKLKASTCYSTIERELPSNYCASLW